MTGFGKNALNRATAEQLEGNLFRTARLQLSQTTLELAQLAGVDHETVLKVESEPHLVSLHEICAVANCLNLDPGCVLEYLHILALCGDQV
ncbi:MAG: helix-turn-helix transcriptional regulator [Deltaproteobacteria bacterium]|nr:helix-turn-helix transcriptional regulator [Deltaproteobacteria bacterium]